MGDCDFAGSRSLTKRLFFLHIHKTAGTSVSRAIESALPDDSTCPINFEYEYFAQKSFKNEHIENNYWQNKLSNYKFFRGHFGLEIRNRYFPDTLVLTFLRDPVERLISCYVFWLRQALNKGIPDNKQHLVALKIRSMDFEEFVSSDDPDIVNATHNVQARILAGGQFGRAPDLRSQVIGPNLGISNILEHALSFITSEHVLVGLNSQVDKILEKLSEHFEITIPKVQHLRKSSLQEKDRVVVTPKSLRRANEITLLDRELFNFISNNKNIEPYHK